MLTGKIEQFDLWSRKCPAYVRRMEQYIYGIKPKKVLDVTSDLQPSYDLMCDLCAPDEPEKKTCEVSTNNRWPSSKLQSAIFFVIEPKSTVIIPVYTSSPLLTVKSYTWKVKPMKLKTWKLQISGNDVKSVVEQHFLRVICGTTCSNSTYDVKHFGYAKILWGVA